MYLVRIVYKMKLNIIQKLIITNNSRNVQTRWCQEANTGNYALTTNNKRIEWMANDGEMPKHSSADDQSEWGRKGGQRVVDGGELGESSKERVFKGGTRMRYVVLLGMKTKTVLWKPLSFSFPLIIGLPLRHILRVFDNRLRMCVIKNIFHSPNYKIATAPYSKTIPHNYFRINVVEKQFSSSAGSKTHRWLNHKHRSQWFPSGYFHKQNFHDEKKVYISNFV